METIPLERGGVWRDLLPLNVPYYAHFQFGVSTRKYFKKKTKKQHFSQIFDCYSTSVHKNTFCFSHIPGSLTTHTHTHTHILLPHQGQIDSSQSNLAFLTNVYIIFGHKTSLLTSECSCKKLRSLLGFNSLHIEGIWCNKCLSDC